MQDMMSTTVEKAVANPTRKFNDPNDVLLRTDLGAVERLAILKSWENEAHQLQAAENESMIGGESTRLIEIRKAIDRLCKEEGLTEQEGC
jgi:hypothetical protein